MSQVLQRVPPDTDLAIALVYRPNQDHAPVISAKGKKGLALQMIREARMYEIPVVRDPALAGLLDALKSGTEIPDNLYRAVVDVFAFLYRSGQVR